MGTWPTRQPGQAIEILMEACTDTHRFTLSADNIIGIQRNELRDNERRDDVGQEDPEFLQMTEGQANCCYINVEEIDALMSVLAVAKAHAS